MRRFVCECAVAGLVILSALLVALLWLPITSDFRTECARVGGSFVAGTDGAADLCVGPG